MQTDYAPERLHTDVPSKEALLAAAQDGSILQATAARCDVHHNLILPLDGMTGIMPREECALCAYAAMWRMYRASAPSSAPSSSSCTNAPETFSPSV